MKCIIGLGNPGSTYAETRHNAGFLAVAHMVSGIRFHRSTDGMYDWAGGSIEGTETVYVLPMTYMNRSGDAVSEFCRLYSVPADDLLVLYDDFQLPFGTLRLRPKGSDGGHNGIASIIESLGTDLIPRLRIGIGNTAMPERHTHESMADFVLSDFSPEEQKLLPSLLQHVQHACRCWVTEGIGPAMSRFNKNFFSSAGAE